MRLLVTGGAGFIGANFVHMAVREGYDVTVVDNLAAGNLDNIKPLIDSKRIKFRGFDIVKEGLRISILVQECDAVVHFAAESHNDNSFRNPAKFYRTNVDGTVNVLELAREYGKRFHHISTDEVFGDLDYDDPNRFTEETPYNPTQAYSASKAGADHSVRANFNQFDQAVTISNCSNNYGPFQHVEKFIPRQITEILMGRKPKLYGDGRNVRDWIHVDDHNRAVLTILERGRLGETYLIGADGERNNLEVLRMILETMGKEPDWFESVPDRPAHDRRYAIDASKLRRELGWEPVHTNFREGLAETIKWYQDHEEWWRPLKETTESKYKELGR